MVKRETAVKAKQCRDALAKALYSRLFDNIVKFVNSALRIKGANTGSTMQVGATYIELQPRESRTLYCWCLLYLSPLLLTLTLFVRRHLF
jgi:hypothetical protein